MDGILFCGIILFFFYNFVLYLLLTLCAISVVVATAKVRIFKQITTDACTKQSKKRLLLLPQRYEFSSKSQLNYVVIRKMQGCCCYRKGTNFQANHNSKVLALAEIAVVVATAKVRIFKQITTYRKFCYHIIELLLLPQRYEFSSKSQLYKQYNE